MRLRTVFLVMSVAFLAAMFGARAGQPEACFAMSPETPAIASTCTYVATVDGGIDGFGSFVVTIVHNGHTTIVDTNNPPAQPTCYSEGPRTLCPIGIVQPGDHVTVHATSTPAFVGVGNPCPVPNPGVPPPVLGGKC